MTDEERVLRAVPKRGEKLESYGIVIEWDYPRPATPVVWKPRADNWYKRLSPLKATPNREARVLRDLKNSTTARSRTNNIRKSLQERDPKSKWKVSQQKDDDGTYGIWVTYQGVMSDEEYEQAVALRGFRSRQAKVRKANAVARRQLRRSMMNPTLTPPVIDDLDSVS